MSVSGSLRGLLFVTAWLVSKLCVLCVECQILPQIVDSLKSPRCLWSWRQWGSSFYKTEQMNRWQQVESLPSPPILNIAHRETHPYRLINTHTHSQHTHTLRRIYAHSFTHSLTHTHKQNLNEIPIILGWAIWPWLHSEPCVTSTKSPPSGNSTHHSWWCKQTFKRLRLWISLLNKSKHVKSLKT